MPHNTVPQELQSYAELLGKEGSPSEFVARVGYAIDKSFAVDLARGSLMVETPTERHHRRKICTKWFRIMRGDLHWSLEKVYDFLPLALRNELDGVPWEPPKNISSWAPSVLG